MTGRLAPGLFALGSLSWAAAQWVIVLLIARFGGGTEAVGLYALALAVATPVFTFAQMGLRTVYISSPGVPPWRTFIRLRSAGLAVACASLCLYFAVFSLVPAAVWLALIALKCADATFELSQARIQRTARLGLVGGLNLAKSVLTVCAVAASFALVDSAERVAAVLAAAAVASLAIAIVSGVLGARQAMPEPGGPDRSIDAAQVLRAGISTAISDSLAALSTYLPILLLSLVGNASDAGVYAAAAYLVTAANLVGSIIKNVVTPSMRITFVKVGAFLVRRRAARWSLQFFLLACAGVPVVVILGDDFLLAVYGPGFGLNAGQLAILALAAVPVPPSQIISAAMNVMGRYFAQTTVWMIAIAAGAAIGIAALLASASPISSALLVSFGVNWSLAFGNAMILGRAPKYGIGKGSGDEGPSSR